MSLSVKSSTEVFGIGVSNRFKSLPREVEVRVKENSGPFISRSFVHIIFKINELISIFYPHLSTDDVIKP